MSGLMMRADLAATAIGDELSRLFGVIHAWDQSLARQLVRAVLVEKKAEG